MKSIKSAIWFSILILGCLSCNGKTPYTNPTGALVGFTEIELVNFSIAGTAVCNWCDASRITALQVEVVPKNDPITTLSMNVFDGLGSFSFSDIRYKKGAKLTLYGRILFGSGDTGIDSTVEITVPGNDGETVSCVMNFPSN